jgi:hypothetical protein
MRLAVPLAAAAFLLVLAPVGGAEVIQRNGVRVAASGRLVPHALPRSGTAPVAVSVAGHISSATPGVLPQLRRIEIAINAHGRLDYRGLPRCRLRQIQPATSREALAACHRALVGSGRFSSEVILAEQSPFPSVGRILAFNGRVGGRPAILAHIYGVDPAPTSYVLDFEIRRSRDNFGTILETTLPVFTGNWGFVTGVSMTLGGSRAADDDYLTAGCPAPSGFESAVFPLMRTTFTFDGGLSLAPTVSQGCRVSR